jgi:hypothetical protein
MKRIFGNCTMILVLGLAAMQTLASAQDNQGENGPGLTGVWWTVVTPITCTTPHQDTGPSIIRGLHMFGQDGSFTSEAAFLVANIPPRSGGVGRWQHTQDHTYAARFQFFRYKPADGSFMVMRQVTLLPIVLNGNQFTSIDQVQDFDKDLVPIPGTASCNRETAIRLQ